MIYEWTLPRVKKTGRYIFFRKKVIGGHLIKGLSFNNDFLLQWNFSK